MIDVKSGEWKRRRRLTCPAEKNGGRLSLFSDVVAAAAAAGRPEQDDDVAPFKFFAAPNLCSSGRS